MACTHKIMCLLAFGVVACAGFTEHIKVDFDGRYDATASGFLSWLATEGASKTFGDLTVSFELITPPASTTLRIAWENKNGLNLYELAMDGLYAYFDDGTTVHPSFNGGTILLTINGLSEGPHTFISYHNALWPVSKYSRTISACKITIDDVESLTVQPSQAVTSDSDVVSTFMTFEATAGQPVRIRFEPVGDTATQICTAIINGFEIDNLASVDSYAYHPTPADGDEHIDANNDDPDDGQVSTGYTLLNWQASEFAEFHDVYFGTSQAGVQNATVSTAGIYRGRQGGNETTWNATELDSQETYFWRIDTVKSDGSITKGYLWRFRVRRLTFPTAEGYGRFARGGRFGRVYEVTTLEDYNLESGETVIDGSLRKAVEVEKGARIVVFRVGGTILLKKKLVVPSDGGDLYVAGQTAPGEGICVARYPFGMLGSKDAIIRFIRTRVGDYAQTSLDGMGMASSDHCIIDHFSNSWSIYEGNSYSVAKNITFSWNIISEAMNDSYQYADHSFAASISGNRGSYHHNLLAHCAGRNWSLAGGLEPSGTQYSGYCDIRNNVVYNWLNRTTDGGVYRCNFVNNYYIPGPASTHFLLMRPDGDQMGTGDPQMFYIVGNKMEGYPQYDADNWDGVSPNYATEQQIRSDTPFFPSYVFTDMAENAYTKVLTGAGATRPVRDDIDKRVVNDVMQRTYTFRGSVDHLLGIIDSQEDAGGYPSLNNGPAPADTDHDGLPDWWEIEKSMNPHSTVGDYYDTNGDPDGDGYTNMDDYLEYLAQGGELFKTYHCTAGIFSDFDGDCRVVLKDFEIFAEAWEQNTVPADINNDTYYDILDVVDFAEGWLECNREPASECG